VISVTPLTCRRLLISLAGESPWELDCSAGQDLLLVVANDDAPTDYGRYVIKSFDRRTRHLKIEAVLEPDGPAAQWAASVVPGEPVRAIRPRSLMTGCSPWNVSVAKWARAFASHRDSEVL
jgi:NADPH-dependent ferric siderophore reductase